MVEPTPIFRQAQDDNEYKNTFGFGLLFNYIFPYKSFVIQLIIGLLAGSLLQLIFPFLTQSVVDVGIQNQNIHFIYMVLAAQLFLFLEKRLWNLLEVGYYFIFLHGLTFP